VKSRRVRLVLVLILFIVLFVLFCSYESTTAPAWQVVVVDNRGTPISGIKIRQAWQYFDVDIAPWDDDSRTTDAHGRARFPRRTTWLSLASRAVLGSNSPIESVGPSFFIQACDDDHMQEAKFFWSGNRYWNPSVHPGVTKLVAIPASVCGEID
jgi:hypothetical protein